MRFSIAGDEDMQQLGREIGAVLDKGDVVYLVGDLGAGKTTLARGISRGLGYTGRVSSPTFTLMNIYPGAKEIYHFDLYRLQGNDLDDLGWEEYLEGDGVSLVEWPLVAENIFPGEALLIRIDLVDEDYEREREVSISAVGRRYQQKLEELKKNVDTGDR